MNKQITISSAKKLIKRELGLNATTLSEQEDMNSSPEHPWYTLYSGTQCIDVFTDDVKQGKYTDKMVVLAITHQNSNRETSEYFYSDTLEYAAPYTEWKNREIFCEDMDNPEKDIQLCRLKREAIDDCHEHFHQASISECLAVAQSKAELHNHKVNHKMKSNIER